MPSHLCNVAVGLLLVAAVSLLHLWQTYVSVFDDEVAYLYNPANDDLFEVVVQANMSEYDMWDYLNPLTRIIRRKPVSTSYIDSLSDIREKIQAEHIQRFNGMQVNLDTPEILFFIDYFRIGQEHFVASFIPEKWIDLVPSEQKSDVMMVRAVIIEQEWPNGLLGEPLPVKKVSIVEEAFMFLGNVATEICIRELTRDFPEFEMVARQEGCRYLGSW